MTSSESQEREPAFSFLLLPFRACLALRRARLITVEPAFFLFMWARHLYLPLYEQYYYVHYGSQILQNTTFPFPNGSFCLNSSDVDTYGGNGSFKLVETASNNLVVYGQIANRIPSIVASIVFGPLSDRFGRKPFLVLIGVGTALQGSLALVTVYFHWNPYYFIIGHFISGAMGDFPGILTAGLSYIADISSKRWRGLRIGMIEAVSGIGSALGPILVGMWLQKNNCDFIPILGFYTASSVAVAFYCLFCIPESLTKSEREALTVNNPKGCRSLIRGIKIYFGFVPEYSAWKLWIAFFVNNLLIFIGAGAIYLAVYFLKAPPFDLDAQAVGIYQSIQCLSRGMANVVLMGIFSAIQMPEAVIALIAMLFNSGGNLLTGLSRKVYQAYTVVAFQGVDTLTLTSMRTLVSKLVAPEDQGAVFGILATGDALFALLSTVAWPNIYDVIINHNLSPGDTFMIMAGMGLLAIPLLLPLIIFHKMKKPVVNNQVDVKKKSSNFTESERLLPDALRSHPPLYSNSTSVTINR